MIGGLFCGPFAPWVLLGLEMFGLMPGPTPTPSVASCVAADIEVEGDEVTMWAAGATFIFDVEYADARTAGEEAETEASFAACWRARAGSALAIEGSEDL